jgi:hypothetical protein
MAAKTWASISTALFIGLTCSAGGIQFGEYRNLLILADTHVKEKYPAINLNMFTKDLLDEGSTVSVSYRFKQADPLTIRMGRAPVVSIDKATMLVIYSYLTTD